MKMRPITVVLLAGTLAATALAQPGPQVEGSPPPPKEQTVTVTYLGVRTSPVPPAVAAQIKLRPGFGLLVNEVVAASPASAAGLKENDVLMKLNDQHLIEPNQLAVLVRDAKPGDEQTVTFIREGVERSVTVKLASREVPIRPRHMGFGPRRGHKGMPGREGGFDEGRLRRKLRDAGRQFPWPAHAMRRANAPSILSREETADYELGFEGGEKVFCVRDKSGNELFRGTVQTAEQRERVPAAYREPLEALEANLDTLLGLSEDDLVPGPVDGPAPIVAPLPGAQI